MMIKVYDRKLKVSFVEKEYGKGLLEFLYGSIPGRVILKTFIITKFYSRINAKKEKSKKSVDKIPAFIKEYNINMTRFEEKDYSSFDDFFTRKLKKECATVDEDEDAFIAPADSKLQVYKIDDAFSVIIKGVEYALEDLLKDAVLAKEYKNGLCLVYRLSVDDYHRYCYIDSGKLKHNKVINGKLHTVRPIANKYKVFKENQREYEVLDTKSLDEIIYMEVGAMQIGKINNHKLVKFNKGEEKGYFSFGGSTIVIIVKDNIVKMDEDILHMNEKDIEVKVGYGERVGTIIKKEF